MKEHFVASTSCCV